MAMLVEVVAICDEYMGGMDLWFTLQAVESIECLKKGERR
jgi:hypothetical protein